MNPLVRFLDLPLSGDHALVEGVVHVLFTSSLHLVYAGKDRCTRHCTAACPSLLSNDVHTLTSTCVQVELYIWGACPLLRSRFVLFRSVRGFTVEHNRHVFGVSLIWDQGLSSFGVLEVSLYDCSDFHSIWENSRLYLKFTVHVVQRDRSDFNKAF